ncbi:hypothetical protein ACIRSS_23995 [Amycolatopsis sp. NPDC101161]|uniref:hypothetical protein n=1 Tax=Amycolatopsis sp. NPDC101161 TaxID=3363940 RepID=UPI0037FB9354
MDPTEISTLPQLADALEQLRRDRSLSLQGLADAAAKLPARGRRRPALPRSTASDLLNAKSVPEAETVMTFLAACGIHDEQAQRPWLQALERAATQHQRRPPGAVRVRDARPRMLGVHAAIQTPQSPEDTQPGLGEGELPLYVLRDFDADLRTKLTLAAQQGGFVLLVGDSSVGKTRALFEAVKATMSDWWLLHPSDAEPLREFAARPTGRTVVWLDELQDYLDFAGGVPAGQIRELIARGVVLVATCWPGEHNKRMALPDDGHSEPYANDRRLLDLADALHVPAAFSPLERRRAEDFAGTDPRIRVALDTHDAGFTQVMAAGPELIRHWNQAPAYAKAIMTAALDARRVGAHAPLTREFFIDAAPGYLNKRDVATAPSDWLENALAYASRLLHGATAALTPVPASMGTIAGYQVADYLHQHALKARRREQLPDTAWHALICHHHPDDTGRLADNADRRGRDHEAATFFQQLAKRGHRYAARRWIDLLAEQGLVEQLRLRADNGDGYAAERLAGRLAIQGQVEKAVQVLRDRPDDSDEYAILRLADRLAVHGKVEEAKQLLRDRADNGDEYATHRLAALLTEDGQVEEAKRILRDRADNGDEYATRQLADLLAEQEQVITETKQVPRDLADISNEHSDHRLTDLLAIQRQMERLRDRAHNGDEHAFHRLADLLAGHGQVEEAIQVLRDRADNGDGHAARRLTDLLAEQRQVEQLRDRADNGDWYAARRLSDLLARQGQVEELEREVVAGTAGAVAALRRVRFGASSMAIDS